MNSNRNFYHSCGKPGHWFNNCPNKRLCPKCKKDFLKWFEVYKTKNAGKLFHTYSVCGHFEFDESPSIVQFEVGESSGSSSSKSGAVDEIIELAHILKVFANITEEKKVKVSVTLTFSKETSSSEDGDEDKDGKGKRKM